MKTIIYLAASLLLWASVGCSRDASPEPSATTSSAPNIDTARFLLHEEPAGGKEVNPGLTLRDIRMYSGG